MHQSLGEGHEISRELPNVYLSCFTKILYFRSHCRYIIPILTLMLKTDHTFHCLEITHFK